MEHNPTLPTTRWHIPKREKAFQDLLVKELGVHPVISRVLVSRNLSNPDEARRFLFPTLKDLHNPFLMPDMDRGVERTIQAIHRHEKIVIYGDYDVDGITSLVILFRFLSELQADVSYYIPDRIEEGYGLNSRSLGEILRRRADLLITVDCGISDHVEIAQARAQGMETIILDHHEVPDTLPPAYAVINANRSDCRFPFKHLAGVGTVFNFLIALRARLREKGYWENRTYPNLMEYLDLVALGTIGDVSPLVDENRIFARIGLNLINEGKRAGIRALKEISGDAQPVDSTSASFSLIPRINAAGRVASPDEAVSLLLSEDSQKASVLARKLDDYNRTRQSLERAIIQEIVDKISSSVDVKNTYAIVLSSPDWHPGVIGIVASKLVDLYYRPALLISLKDGIGKGSGRSIPEFNLHRGLANCQSLLISHGGHRYAAGISIREENIDDLRHLLDNIARGELGHTDLVPRTNIDALCELGEIDGHLMSQLALLAPFGSMNPEPLLCAQNVSILSPAVVGNNHLRMRAFDEGLSFNSIWFGKGRFLPAIQDGKLDIVFTPQLNHWNGTSSIQLKMKDMVRSGSNPEET